MAETSGLRQGTPWAGTRVLVAGARRTGAAVAETLLDLGALVTVVDGDPAQLTALDGLAARGATLDTDLTRLPPGCDLVVTSPGFRLDSPTALAAAAAGVEMIGEPELAWRLGAEPAVCPDGPPTWLAVTGTNGKTTTTTMLEAILRAAGEDAVACGNIGLPVVEANPPSSTHRTIQTTLGSLVFLGHPAGTPAQLCLPTNTCPVLRSPCPHAIHELLGPIE